MLNNCRCFLPTNFQALQRRSGILCHCTASQSLLMFATQVRATRSVALAPLATNRLRRALCVGKNCRFLGCKTNFLRFWEPKINAKKERNDKMATKKRNGTLTGRYANFYQLAPLAAYATPYGRSRRSLRSLVPSHRASHRPLASLALTPCRNVRPGNY